MSLECPHCKLTMKVSDKDLPKTSLEKYYECPHCEGPISLAWYAIVLAKITAKKEQSIKWWSWW